MMWRAKRKIQRLLGLLEMGGLAVFPLKEALWVSLHEAISNLWSPGGAGLQALGEKWAINKGLAGLKKFAEGLRL